MEIKQENPVSIVPVIYEIVKNAFVREYDLIPETLEEVADFIKESLVYVAYDEKTPIGYFVLKDIESDKQEFKSIAVHKDQQRKGVGKLMMNKVLDLSGVKTLELVTHPKNTQALVMYLKYGFIVTGWIDDYLGDGQPRLKMVRLADASK